MTISNVSNVPEKQVIRGDFWRAMGDRPHDTLVTLLDGRAIAFVEFHHIPGHSPSGAWITGSAEVTRRVMLDSETFTSHRTTSLSQLLGEDLKIVPIEQDAAEHAKYRAVLAEHFKPAAVSKLTGKIEAIADDLLDRILPQGRCDFVGEFGKILPAAIFLDLFGLPQSDRSRFLHLSNTMMSSPSASERIAALRTIRSILEAEVVKRRIHPTRDLLSTWANAVIDGRPVTPAETMGGLMLLFTAGLDTVAALIAWTFRHLAENPNDQQLLREDPALIGRSLDEFLRFFASVSANRRATRDIEVAGANIRSGDTIICATTPASRDPDEFDNAGVMDIRRGPQRHMAFGYGIHTCIGMHLGRLELQVALKQWLTRCSPFRLSQDVAIHSHGGAVIALDNLPLVWELWDNR